MVCSGTACVLDFLSGEIDFGSEMTKLHIVYTMMIYLPIFTLYQIIMHCDVPRVGQLVGVGVTVTVTVVVIVMNSGDAVSTHKRNKEYIALTWSTSYILGHEGTNKTVVFSWFLRIYVPCKVDDGEGRGEGVISGTPVVSDGVVIVGGILTA